MRRRRGAHKTLPDARVVLVLVPKITFLFHFFQPQFQGLDLVQQYRIVLALLQLLPGRLQLVQNCFLVFHVRFQISIYLLNPNIHVAEAQVQQIFWELLEAVGGELALVLEVVRDLRGASRIGLKLEKEATHVIVRWTRVHPRK